MEEAWLFVTENRSIINRYCKVLVQGTSLDLNDFIQQSIVNIAVAYGSFDKDRGTVKTFIWWRIRLTKRNLVRSIYKMGIPTPNPAASMFISEESIENKTSVSILLSKLNEKDRLACESYLRGLSKDSIQEECGISYATRNMRMYRLREKLDEKRPETDYSPVKEY